jgi:hypothetical protein
MWQLAIAKRCQSFAAAATAVCALGFLAISPSAQAHPMLPLAPACTQWGFPGAFSLKQSNGDTVRFNATGSVISVRVPATATGGINGPLQGFATGEIRGDKIDLYIPWTNDSAGDYTGLVGDGGFAHGQTQEVTHPENSAFWDSTVPLACTTAAPPAAAPAAPPPPPDAQTTAARLGVAATGPTTLATGASGTYTVNVSNPGDAGAPVELFVSFNGNLQQTGQPTSSGGFNCEVNNYAGGTSSVHCTDPQFGAKATASITMQGRGSAPGAGQLVVNINSSDPAAQFVQKSQQVNVSIT